jgi:hypothetical protein
MKGKVLDCGGFALSLQREKKERKDVVHECIDKDGVCGGAAGGKYDGSSTGCAGES